MFKLFTLFILTENKIIKSLTKLKENDYTIYPNTYQHSSICI